MRTTPVSRILLSVFLLSSIACGSSDPAASPAVASGPGFTDLLSASHSALRSPQREVITDEADWSSVWRSIVAGINPAPTEPVVNMSQQVIIIAALGEKPSGGFTIHIDSVRSSGTGRDVYVTTTKPGPSCISTAVLTQPVHVVMAPVSAGSTRFVEAETTRNCS